MQTVDENLVNLITKGALWLMKVFGVLTKLSSKSKMVIAYMTFF